MFLFNILCSLFVGGKHVSIRLRNCLPMFDATCLLYGGLNHVMFLFLLFFGLLKNIEQKHSKTKLQMYAKCKTNHIQSQQSNTYQR